MYFDDIDKSLLVLVADGDVKAFEKLYLTLQKKIYRFIFNFAKSPDLAEDLTQELFMKLWNKRADLVNLDSFSSYLFIISKNHVLNFLKKAAKEQAAKGEILKHYQTDTQNTGENKLANEEYRQFIETVLNSLPAQTRQIFRLCREEYKSYDEVAILLGISRNTVKKHIVRSNKLFRDSLNDNTDISLKFLIIMLFYAEF